MTTTTHTLKMIAGNLIVTIHETVDAVFVGVSGVKARGCEAPKLKRFLWPLIDQFRNDMRRMEINGAHCNYTGHIETHPFGAVLAYTAPKGRQQ